MIVFKIAWRNISRHKGKSLVIGSILFLGALLMTMGNATVLGTKNGISENLVERFTGHIILVSNKEKKDNVLFSPTGKSLTVLHDYPKIKTFLDDQEIIANYIPMTKGVAMVIDTDMDVGTKMILGVNIEKYQAMFKNNIEIVEGRLLSGNERGILISEKTRTQMYRTHGFWLSPEGYPLDGENLSRAAKAEGKKLDVRHELILLGRREDSFSTDVRVPVRGLIKFNALNGIWSNNSFMDLESFRECFGYFAAGDTEVVLSDNDQLLLESDNEDDIFGSGDIFSDAEVDTTSYEIESLKIQSIKKNKPVNPDNGVYNFISIKLKPGVSIKNGKKMLEQRIKQAGIDIRVLPWDKATGQFYQLVQIMQGVLTAFVFILFFIALLMIMNTLSMTAIERTEEIGMMRAIGAQSSFIAQMFFTETSFLLFLFGGIGILSGTIMVFIIRSMHITARGNDLLELFFGNDTFSPTVSPSSFLYGIILLGIVTLLAMAYPIIVALRITPIDAISRR